MSKKINKSTITLILSFVLIFSLVACNQDNAGKDSSANPENAASTDQSSENKKEAKETKEEKEDSTASESEPAYTKDYRVTSEWGMTEDGKFFVDASIQNKTDEVKEDIGVHFHLKMKDGKEFDLGSHKLPKLAAQETKKFKHDFSEALEDTDYGIDDFQAFRIEIE